MKAQEKTLANQKQCLSPAITATLGKTAPTRPIKVLVLRSVSGTGGGAESIILRTAQCIDRHQIELVVACIRRSDDLLFNFGDKILPTGVEYHEVKQRGLFDRRVWDQIRHIYETCRPDVVDAHDYKASYYARKLWRRYGVLPMATLHGWTGDSLRERFLYYPIDRLLVRHFPALVAVSNQIRETMTRWGADPDRVIAIPNGIDVQDFGKDIAKRHKIRRELALTDEDFLIGAVGRLELQKRFDLLLDAISVIDRRERKVRAVIVGEGSLRTALEAQIKRLGLQDCCRLLGHREDVRDLYSAFDLLVQSSDYEGTPTVVVEAMACETPIIATDAGGTRDLIEDQIHALVVPVRSPGRMAQTIESIMRDPAGTASRVVAAKQRAIQDLSFHTRTGRIIEVYKSLADSASPYQKSALHATWK